MDLFLPHSAERQSRIEQVAQELILESNRVEKLASTKVRKLFG